MMLRQGESDEKVSIQRQPDHDDSEAGRGRRTGGRPLPRAWHEQRPVLRVAKQDWQYAVYSEPSEKTG